MGEGISYQSGDGDLYEKGDYHIKQYTRFTSDTVNGREFAAPREVLLLNTSRVFMLYKEAARRSGDKIIPDDALREYINISSQLQAARQRQMEYLASVDGATVEALPEEVKEIN